MAEPLEDNQSNPESLLQYDPAAVVIRAAASPDTIQQLQTFASTLTHYLGRATEHQSIDLDEEEDARMWVPKGEKRGRCDRSSSQPDDAEPTPKKQRGETKPQQPPANYMGTLVESTLQRSVGHTRKILNKNLQKLGLTACFGQGVVSKHGSVVSHLTFNALWNALPYDEKEPLHWWVGDGPMRLKLAQPLDPSVYEQPSLPIFWAVPAKRGGGALCHYVGHFQCMSFEKHETKVVKMKHDRQALVAFQFVHFDASLSKQLSELAAP